MLRKRGVQDALLLEASFGVESSCDDPSEVDLRLTVHCEGLSGRIKVCRDGSFSFKQTEVIAHGLHPLRHVGEPA